MITKHEATARVTDNDERVYVMILTDYYLVTSTEKLAYMMAY